MKEGDELPFEWLQPSPIMHATRHFYNLCYLGNPSFAKNSASYHQELAALVGYERRALQLTKKVKN